MLHGDKRVGANGVHMEAGKGRLEIRESRQGIGGKRTA